MQCEAWTYVVRVLWFNLFYHRDYILPTLLFLLLRSARPGQLSQRQVPNSHARRGSCHSIQRRRTQNGYSSRHDCFFRKSRFYQLHNARRNQSATEENES